MTRPRRNRAEQREARRLQAELDVSYAHALRLVREARAATRATESPPPPTEDEA